MGVKKERKKEKREEGGRWMDGMNIAWPTKIEMRTMCSSRKGVKEGQEMKAEGPEEEASY